MNFLKDLQDIESRFVFYELDQDRELGILNLKKGLQLPLSKSGIDKIDSDKIDLNVKVTFFNMAHIIAYDPTSKIAKMYVNFFRDIHDLDENILKGVFSDCNLSLLDNLVALYGYAISTEDIYFYNLLGKALIDNHLETASAELLDDCVEIFGKSNEILENSNAYYYLSFVESEREDYIKAYEYARKALEHNPEPKVKETLEKGMQLIKDRSDVQQAGKLLHENNFDLSLEILEETTAVSDEMWEKHLYLGENYAARGDMSKAISSLKRAIELNPSNPEIYSSLGLVSVMVGDYLKAKEFFETGIKLEPLNTDLLKNLALLYMRISRQTLAIDIMENVLNITPDDEEAKEMLQEMKERYNESLAD